MTSPHAPRLSVIVCTRNRAARLTRTLESLVAQRMEPADWEILVVDNGSSDGTDQVVWDFASRGPVRYTSEPTPGLNRARNKGIAMARAKLLAFTDDDVFAHEDWASRILAGFDADPNAAAVFGYTYAVPEISPLFSLRTRPHSCVIAGKENVWESSPGNNMAFRRAAIAEIGLFDPLLDVGSKYPGAGDGEFQYRFFKAGFTAFYDPDIKVRHEPDVTNRAQAEEYFKADVGAGAWYCKHLLQADFYAGRMLFRHLRRIVGMRSLMPLIRQRDGRELAFRLRRLGWVTWAFVSRAADEITQHVRNGASTAVDVVARAVARACEPFGFATEMLRRSHFKGKHRIAMQFRPVERVGDLGGIQYSLDLADGIQRLAYFDLYQENDMEDALAEIESGATCLDVGANVGVFALNFAKAVGPSGSVHAFEPNPTTCARLRKNVTLNGFEQVVRTYETALSDSVGTATFYEGDHSAWSSLCEFNDIAANAIQVPTDTLDNFLQRQGIRNVDFLKVDVEAAEFELLKGAQRSLRDHVFRRILIEFNGVRLAERHRTLAEFLQLFAGFGYGPVGQNLDLLERMRQDRQLAQRQCINLQFEPVLQSSGNTAQRADDGRAVSA